MCAIRDGVFRLGLKWFVLLVYLLGLSQGGSATGAPNTNAIGCASDCLKCSPSQGGCVKCPELIVYGSRLCVSTCPAGHRSQWSTVTAYMGRVCVSRGRRGLSPAQGLLEPETSSLMGGMSSEAITILTGIVTGALLCILIITFAIVYVHYKRKVLEQSSSSTSSDSSSNSSTAAAVSAEMRDFVKRVEILRPHAATFLAMLNETRAQLRVTCRTATSNASNTGSVAQQVAAATALYRPLLADLAKVLILVNRRPREEEEIGGRNGGRYGRRNGAGGDGRNGSCNGGCNVTPLPQDWEHLFNWAESTLRRRLREETLGSSGNNGNSVGDVGGQPQQVAQLISFLQGSSQNIIDDTVSTGSSSNSHNSCDKNPVTNTNTSPSHHVTMSTFKPDQSLGGSSSLLSLQDAAVENFTANYTTNTGMGMGAPPALALLNPQWRFEYSLVASESNKNNKQLHPLSQFSPQQWKHAIGGGGGGGNLHYYLDEEDDDFGQLGFRPQDEITTEL